jgi:hypothetical protein
MAKPNRRKASQSPSAARKRRSATFKHVLEPDGRVRHVRYEPGTLKVDWTDTLSRARNGDPDFALVLLLASFTQHWMRGHAANVCVQACVHLQDAATLLGISSVITPVKVVVEEPGRRRTVYGTATPEWNGPAFSGHCTVFMPDEGRMVDPTIRQLDGFQELPYPYVGRVVYSSTSGRALPAGAKLRVEVIDRFLEYHVVEGGEALVRDAEASQHAVAVNPDLPGAIAAQTLDAIRALGIAERLPARHSRIAVLLNAIGDAPLHQEGSQVTFVIGGSPTRVDSILD